MTDVTPPHPPHPKAAAKGIAGLFKNQPKWVLIAGFTVLAGVAYFAWSRSRTADPTTQDPQAGASADTLYQQPDGAMAGGDYGGGYVTAPASQGAYGGYDYPPDLGTGLADTAGAPESVVVNVTPGPATASSDVADVPTDPTGSPTGGGHPARGVHHHLPVKPKHKKHPPHPTKPGANHKTKPKPSLRGRVTGRPKVGAGAGAIANPTHKKKPRR